MRSDENRKRKAVQTANMSSKKHKTDSPIAPTRPATRSISKGQSAYATRVHSTSTRSRDQSSGPSGSPATGTRSKTGSLKSKTCLCSPNEERAPPPPSGLSQWVTELEQRNHRENANLSSTRTSLSRKRPKAPPSPPPKPEEIIVISSDEDEDPRPRKRTRLHTPQCSQIIDLSKDNTPPPRPRPTRLRPAPLTAPTPASPSKYLDLRRLSNFGSKPKSPSSQPQPQTPTGLRTGKTKLPAAPSPAEIRRRRQNDMFDDDDEKGTPASELPAVEVVRRKSALTRTCRSKPNPTPTTEPEPERNLSPTHVIAGAMESMSALEGAALEGGTSEKGMVLPIAEDEHIRLREEEEEADITSPTPMENIIITGTTTPITEDAKVDNSPARLAIKTEDVEDTYINHQLSTSNREEEQLLFVKEEPQSVEPSPTADLWVDEQEQVNFEEAIFQSMLSASAMEDAVPLANEGESQVDVTDASLTMPMVSSIPVCDVTSVREVVQSEKQVVLEEADKQEADQEVQADAKDAEAEKVPEEEAEEPTSYLSCISTHTPAPALDLDSYLDFELESQEHDDLEEAPFQSHSAIAYSLPNLKQQDEDKFGVEQEQNHNETDQDHEQVGSSDENTRSVYIAGQLTRRFFAQSCLPPKAKTMMAKHVNMEEPVVQVWMAKPVLETEMQNVIEEEKEEPLVKASVQSETERMQSVIEEVLVQREVHEEVQSPIGRMVEVEKSFEELPVQSEPGEMQMLVLLDPDVPDVEKILEIEDVEIAMETVEVDVQSQHEEGNEDGDREEREDVASVANVVPIPSPTDGNAVDMNVLPQWVGDTVLSENDVIGVAQEIENEISQAETATTTSLHATEDTDVIEATLQPEFEAASSKQAKVSGVEEPYVKVKATTTEALERDPILSRALHGSRVLLGIIQGIIHTPKPKLEVAPVDIQVEEAGDGVAHSPLSQMSTPEAEIMSLFEDDSMLSSRDEDPSFPQKSSSEPSTSTDYDPSLRSVDVVPFSLQVDGVLTPEHPVEIEPPNHAPRFHEVPSPSARASTQEPFTHQIEGMIASSLPTSPSVLPHTLTSNEGASVAPDRPLKVSSACSRTLILGPFALAGESDVTSRTLESESRGVPLSLTLTSFQKSPSRSPDYLPIEDVTSMQQNSTRLLDKEQPFVQSAVSISEMLPALGLDSQRRTISNSGSESSLATLEDSPSPSTPSRSAFEAYYIRSTSPDDDLGPDIFSKLTDIPLYPRLAESDEDDEYLLSLNLSYPDFDIPQCN